MRVAAASCALSGARSWLLVCETVISLSPTWLHAIAQRLHRARVVVCVDESIDAVFVCVGPSEASSIDLQRVERGAWAQAIAQR